MAHSDPLNLALAFELIEAGFPVFPVGAGGATGKKPLTEHGYHNASLDAATVRHWFTKHPHALVAYPTSGATTVALDVDGPVGLESLATLCRTIGIDEEADLTPLRIRSPFSTGMHLHFRLRDGEVFRSRASDIAPGLDTRGVKEDGSPAGYIIAPGNRLPDGRCYAHAGESHDLSDAAFVPSRLLYLATFNRAQRSKITRTPPLLALIRDSCRADWCTILADYTARELAAIIRMQGPVSDNAMQRQAAGDLNEATKELATLKDGRRNGLFLIACRVAKYVALGALTESEFAARFMAAAAANGSTAKHGAAWAQGVLRRALECGRNDPPPPIAARYRDGGMVAV